MDEGKSGKEDRLDGLMDEIGESPELTLFFKRLVENPTYSKVFLLHREQLFPSLGETTVPYLLWNNLEDQSKAQRHLRTIATSAELEKIRSEQAEGFFESIFLDASEDIKDLLVFGVIKFVRENVAVKNLINEEDFDYLRMKKTLGDYASLNLQFLQEISESEGVKGIDPVVAGKVKRLAKVFGEGLTKPLLQMLELVADIVPDALTSYHVGGYRHLNQLLVDSALQTHEYGDLLTELHSQGVISNLHTVSSCVNCMDNPIILKTKSEIGPHHLRMNCSRCEEEMAVSAIFSLIG